MSKPTLTVTADFTEKVNEILKKFKRDAVLVGIPEDGTKRNDADETITNAAILAINEFGSPANNIPARPAMAIGIKNAQDEIAEEFRKAAIGALTRGLSALSVAYNRAGLLASTAVKKAINAQEGFSGPSEATLRAREARGFKGTKALIVTGQMRNAITYVVKGEE